MADIYDEEFERKLNFAKTLLKELRSKKDRDICRKWMKRLCTLKSDDVSVKKNRNAFFQYMLRILLQATTPRYPPTDAMPRYDDMYTLSEPDPFKEIAFMKKWSEDKRTYVAAQALPGRGALIYMAVAKDPSLGWDVPFKHGQK